MLIPTDINVGLTSVSLGIINLMEQKGLRLMVFKPIEQPNFNKNKDQTTEILRFHTNVNLIKPLKIDYVESLLKKNQKNILMEKIVALYYDNKKDTKVILIQGLIPMPQHPFAKSLNYDIANMLGANVIFITSSINKTQKQLTNRIKLLRYEFSCLQNINISGVIINKINAPIDEYDKKHPILSEIFYKSNKVTGITTETKFKNLVNDCFLPILGCIPWNIDLIATRVVDIANYLNAIILHEGELQTRRIQSVIFCSCNISKIVKLFRIGALLVTSSDRYDVIIAVCLAVMNGIKIGALLLTGGHNFNKSIYNLCQRAFATGLPILMVNTNTWKTSLNLQNFSLYLHVDDHERITKTKNHIALHINHQWINSLTTDSIRSNRLSPPVFRYQLTSLARKANKRIVLPEGNEFRTIKAAAICAERGIATCILLGDPDEIKQVAVKQGIDFYTRNTRIEILSPKLVRKNYVNRLVELRKNKGMTESIAINQLKDNVVLGTMMLENDEVDGLVSGAVHITANTIRPSLQLIKTSPGNSIISSIFFMLLPEQVLVYGDCAINPDPTAEQLSEIAIQSADSAKSFGIEPRVAMISYSTGNSGTGNDVDKVRKATVLAQLKRPDLIIDGPLQYDAAIMVDVAKSKAPNSPIAGQATVFIFPDLNTGNTTYKAVQRSANIVSIGPMLQGIRKPVNDLSRGALVDDIVYTIAITAIQSINHKNH